MRSTIINVGSGKYLNIDSGVDEEGRNVNQYQGYPVAQQQFHLVYEPAGDSYWFYPMNQEISKARPHGDRQIYDIPEYESEYLSIKSNHRKMVQGLSPQSEVDYSRREMRAPFSTRE